MAFSRTDVRQSFQTGRRARRQTRLTKSGPMELNIPAIEVIAEASLYLVRSLTATGLIVRLRFSVTWEVPRQRLRTHTPSGFATYEVAALRERVSQRTSLITAQRQYPLK